MIDGIEAKISTTLRKHSANFFGAIFAMNSAVKTPTGKEISSDKKTI